MTTLKYILIILLAVFEIEILRVINHYDFLSFIAGEIYVFLLVFGGLYEP